MADDNCSRHMRRTALQVADGRLYDFSEGEPMKKRSKVDPDLKSKYKEVVSAFCDLLDGSRGPGQIHYNTGIDPSRCEEIWRLFKSDEVQKAWLGSIRGL